MRAHLSHLDRAIARLLDERARLVVEMTKDGASGAVCEPFTDDVLRRAEGDFPAGELKDVFEAVARGCRQVAEGVVR